MTAQRILHLIASLALLAIAILAHLFYIDYRASENDLIFRLWDADQNNEITNSRVRKVLSYSPYYLYERHTSWYRQNAPLSPGERAEVSKLAAEHPLGSSFMTSRLMREAYLKKKSATEELRRELIKGVRRTIVPYGIAPSANLGGSERLRRRDAFWFGIALPTVLLAGSLSLLITSLLKRIPNGTRVLNGQANNAEETRPRADFRFEHGQPQTHAGPKSVMKENRTLATMLLDDLGSEFPVHSGNGKEEDPLILTSAIDYVSVEYAVVRHVLGTVREDYKLLRQNLISKGDRMIDELIFEVRPIGAQDWTGIRRFYFDVTAGFSSL